MTHMDETGICERRETARTQRGRRWTHNLQMAAQSECILSRQNQIEDPTFDETSKARKRRVADIGHNAVDLQSLTGQFQAAERLANHGRRRTYEPVAATADQ